MNVSNIRKALIQFAGAVGVVIVAAISDHRITGVEGWSIAVAAASAALTYLIPNTLALPYAKFIQAALGPCVLALYTVTAHGGSPTTSDWWQIGVLAVTSAFVYLFPNAQPVVPTANPQAAAV